ncbi:hypothetical protein [Microbacterium sp. Bi121]|uniref:hypothetical protein n=1 Tax=Microbacterium sp. Bi121 TaxID=2822348 RepID=UPI001E4284C8|nr:hypothetical protein [Microbacterium sp. Bi121]
MSDARSPAARRAKAGRRRWIRKLAMPAGAMLLALTAALAGCGAGEPAQTSTTPAPAAESPPPSASPSPQAPIAFTDAVLQGDVYESGMGAELVLVRPDDEPDQAYLYSMTAQVPGLIHLDVAADEEIAGVHWAVEQDPDSDPKAVALVYVTTEASGLNAVPDRVQMRVYDERGDELLREDLGNGIVGTPIEPGWDFTADPSAYGTLVAGVLVFSTELEDGTFAVVGYDIEDASELWRTTGAIRPEEAGAPLANGLVALDWQETLSAFDPRTGAIRWTAPQMNSVHAQGAVSQYLTAYESASAWIGPDPVTFLDIDTGGVLDPAQKFHSYAVDQLTGGMSFAWYVLDGGSSDEPGFLVRSADGEETISLDANSAHAAGVEDVVGMWNGLIWLTNSSGLDVVDASTGDRISQITESNEVLRVPEDARASWTLLRIDGGTFSDDTLILARHPQGEPTVDDLNIFTRPEAPQ